MRLPVVSVALAAVLVLAPVAAGYASASAQDFSITNKIAPTMEGSNLHPDWVKRLQEWWGTHAYYPKAASERDESGTVKVHLVIHQDGNIWTIEVVQSSGSRALDEAALAVFHYGYLRPFPPGMSEPQADVTISLHYVLTHRHDQVLAASYKPGASKIPFTITNDPDPATVFNTWLQKTCTGVVAKDGWRNHPAYGAKYPVKAVFYRKPDGSQWVKIWSISNPNVESSNPITEVGKSAQWAVLAGVGSTGATMTYYSVWPDGENRLTGDIRQPRGTVDFTCETETVPQITSGAWNEVP